MAFESVFLQTFLYLAAALVAVLLGKRTGLGAVLGYLAVGAAIGPWGLHLMGDDGHHVTHFAEFGVVVMLFLIGLELHPSMLWRMRRQVFGLGTAQVALTVAAIGGLLIGVAGMDWKPALAAGLILSLSSTAIVLQTLNEKGLLRTQAGQDSFAVLLFQDIAAIPMLAFLPLLGAAVAGGGAASSGPAWMAGVPQMLRPLIVPGAVALMIVIARAGVRPLFSLVARTGQREAFTAMALFVVIGVALLMTLVGLSPALGAFVAGMVLASSEYRHELEADLEPFKGLLLGLFFMGVGAGIDFGYVGRNLPLVLGGTVALIVIKGALLVLISKLQGSTWRPAFMFGASLAVGGEFAFVLISIARSASVLSEDVNRALSAIVAISMAATPLLIEAVRRTLARAAKGKAAPERESDVVDEGHPVIICGFGRFGHAVGRLLSLRGIGCTVLDRDTDQVETLRSFGAPVFFGDASRPDLLATAGAARAKVLVVTLRDADTTMRIVKTCQKYFPHLRLYIRAWSRTEAYEYISAGENRIYRDTLDSSLSMGVDILRDDFAMPEADARRFAGLYRERDEQTVREMARFRNDEKARLNAAREAVRSLEEILSKDMREAGAGAHEAAPVRQA